MSLFPQRFAQWHGFALKNAINIVPLWQNTQPFISFRSTMLPVVGNGTYILW